MTSEAPIFFDQAARKAVEVESEGLAIRYVSYLRSGNEQLQRAIDALGADGGVYVQDGRVTRSRQAISEFGEWQRELRGLGVEILGLGLGATQQAIDEILEKKREALDEEIGRTPKGVIQTSPSVIGGRQRISFLRQRREYLLRLTEQGV